MTTELERDSFIGTPTNCGFEIERRVAEGWEIDPDRPLSLFGYGTLEVGFLRDPANAKEAKPKRTRAEILADARAAKAEKAKQAQQTEENSEAQPE